MKYTNCNAPNAKVVISCTNWRNPNRAVMVPGFSILTFDKHGDHPLDFSTTFALDGTGLQFAQIEDSSLIVDIVESFPNELTQYKITFETPNHIDSDAGCFVKYTFPPELDISQVDFLNV